MCGGNLFLYEGFVRGISVNKAMIKRCELPNILHYVWEPSYTKFHIDLPAGTVKFLELSRYYI